MARVTLWSIGRTLSRISDLQVRPSDAGIGTGSGDYYRGPESVEITSMNGRPNAAIIVGGAPAMGNGPFYRMVLWDLATRRLTRAKGLSTGERFDSEKAVPEGRWLIAPVDGRPRVVWPAVAAEARAFSGLVEEGGTFDLASGKPIRTPGLPGEPLAAGAVDGRMAVLTGAQLTDSTDDGTQGKTVGRIAVVDIGHGEEITGVFRPTLTGGSNATTSGAIMKAGGAAFAVTGHRDGTLRVWDIATVQLVFEHANARRTAITELEVGERNGETVLVAADHGGIQIWEIHP